MSTKVVGKLDSWADGDTGRNDFMRLEEGSNHVRCLTSPYQFYTHWSQDTTGQNRKLRCAVKDCPLCQQGEQAQARWYVGVLNRRTNKPAILEIGPQIFKQIMDLFKNQKWGDPRAYDVDVKRNPKGTQPLYTIIPEPKESLSAEEKEVIKAFLTSVDLDKMVEVPTPDSIREKLGMAPVRKPAAATAVTEPAEASTDDSDFDFNV
jgi:hypothetical protein